MKMKLSYPVCIPETQEEIMAWCENPENGIKYLSRNGYEGIELLVKDPASVEKEKLQQILKENEMTISAIGTTPMQKEDRLFLLSENQEIREEAEKRLEGLISLAEYFQAPVLIGKYRGTVKDADFCRMQDLERIIGRADQMAEKKNVELFIEPQNADNINNLNTVGETVEWIEKSGFSNVRLLMDIFHMDKTEKSPEDTLTEYRDYIGMIHMSDFERKVPGFGKIDMGKILGKLEKIGYQGYFSMEIKQKPDTKFVAALSALSLQYMGGGN